MKFFVVFALLISCAFAVDWSTYNCASVGTLQANAFTCAEWVTIPYGNSNPLAQCLSPSAACGILNNCVITNMALYNAITYNCANGQNSLGGKTTTTGTTGARP